MTNMLLFISNIIDLSIPVIYIQYFISYQKISFKKFLFILLFAILLTFINALNFIHINLVIYSVVLIVLLCILYEIKKFNLIVFSLIYIIISALCELLTHFILNYISDNFIIFMIINLILKSLSIILYQPLKDILLDQIDTTDIMPLLLLPASTWLIIYGILQNIDAINIYIRVGVITLYFSNFIAAYAIHNINKRKELEKKFKIWNTKSKSMTCITN